MKNIRNYFIKIVFILSCCVLCFACGEKSGVSEDDGIKALKVGVMFGIESTLMNTVAEVALKDDNIHIKIVNFFDYSEVNKALANGEIDVNIFQHRPFLEKDRARFSIDLAIVGDTFLYPMAAYSKKISNIKQLKHGATIAIPKDPTNEKRALKLLEDYGLIKLNKYKNNLLDIISNKNEYEFMLLDASQLYISLRDADIALINSNYATSKNLIASKNGLIIEGNQSVYKNIIVARENNKNDPRIKALIKAYKNPKVKNKAKELFHDSVIF